MWFRKPKNIAIAIIAFVTFVTALTLLILGVTNNTEEDMLQICIDETNKNVIGYIDTSELETERSLNEPCPRTSKLYWKKTEIPLSLKAISINGEQMEENEPEMRILIQTVSDINSQVGFELYRVDPGLHSSGAEIFFGGIIEAAYPQPAGYVSHCTPRIHGTMDRGFRLYGVGHIHLLSSIDNDRDLALVLTHELLHFIGLAHDDYRDSIMYPFPYEDWDSKIMSSAHITDTDRTTLRALYMP